MFCKATAVCGLIRGYADAEKYATLIERNRAIAAVLYSQAPGDLDILLFHEGNIGAEQQRHIQSQTPELPLRFVDVSAEFNPSLVRTASQHCQSTHTSQRFPVGYKHMCRFWFHAFFKYTESYRFVLRIDEDCVLQHFDYAGLKGRLDSKELAYITPYWSTDSGDVTMGLAKLATTFAAEKQLQVAAWPCLSKNPYTNVFFMDASVVRSLPHFQNFIDKVEATGCIYVNRWGDLPLWGVVLWCLLPTRLAAQSPRIGYFHGSHKKLINSNKLPSQPRSSQHAQTK